MNASATPSVRIEQVFHGYNRGHKELAASIRLDEESRATMLVYSDLLADIDEGSDASYLTCYSLPAASRHVLARTWPAGGGYRPGSVWTHSLVLDYQALAQLADLVALEPLLMRSGSIERGRAVKPLLVQTILSNEDPIEFGPNAGVAIKGLYGRREGEVAVPARTPAENDLLALALWRQMWPSLRREFTFVTGVGAGRPAPGADWMLRFCVDPSAEVHLDLGLQALLDDLPASGHTPLRRFLSRYAVEASAPRRIARPLAELWLMPKVGFEKRLRAVRDLTDDVPLPRLTRDLISAELDSAADPTAILVAVREFGDQPLEIDPNRVVRMAEALDDAAFRSLLSAAAAAQPDRLGGRVFEAAVRGMNLERLADASEAAARPAMLRLRPELLNIARFWPEDDARRAALISEHAGEIDLAKGWKLFGNKIGPRTAELLLDKDPNPPVSILIKLLLEGSSEVISRVANRVIRSVFLSVSILEAGDARLMTRLAEAQIASATLPSSPSHWCAAVRRSGAASAAPSALIICFVSSLLVNGNEGLEAARRVYDPMQRLVRGYRLLREQERYLEAALSSRGRGWGLSDLLMKSALTQWPPEGTNAQALILSEEYDHYRDLVNEALQRYGRSQLRQTLLDPSMPIDVRSYMKTKLAVSAAKSWWF